MSPTFHDHFSSVATRYAEFRPHYPPPLFHWLATLVPPQATVWDCASGNGQASVSLAQRFDRIIATDASPDQIASAQPHPHIDYRVAPAHHSGLAPASIHLITVAQALHWFDLQAFYAEAQRLLAPEGVIAVWAYGIQQTDDAPTHKIILDFYHHVVGPYWPPERQLVESGYRTLPFPFHEIATPPFVMEAQWSLDALMGYFSTWSATTRYVKATGQNPLPGLRERLAAVWGNPDTRRSIYWPLSLRVGRHRPTPSAPSFGDGPRYPTPSQPLPSINPPQNTP